MIPQQRRRARREGSAAGEFAPAIALRNKLASTAPGRIDEAQRWVTSVKHAPVPATAVTDTLVALQEAKRRSPVEFRTSWVLNLG